MINTLNWGNESKQQQTIYNDIMNFDKQALRINKANQLILEEKTGIP
jgi:hypothetical protein